MNNREIQPPAWALWLLQKFCPEDLYETIEGDMIEKFRDDIELSGPSRAKAIFIFNTFKFMSLGIESMKNRKVELNNNIMVQHHLKSAIGHLKGNKVIAFVNILGLTVALCVCLTTGIYLHNEFNFDSHHDYSERTYRVNMLWKEHGEEYPLYSTPMIMSDVLSQEITGVEYVVRAHPLTKAPIEVPSRDPFNAR